MKLTTKVLNVIRVALDRADMSHRATGFKDFEVTAAKEAVSAMLAAPSAPAQSEVAEPVAYLDIGAGGYIDLGSSWTDEQLKALPHGRHALGIVGTFGVDGYVPATPPQASPVADEREAFELWMFDREARRPTTWDKECAPDAPPKHKSGHYFLLMDQQRWEVWQARAALASQPVADEREAFETQTFFDTEDNDPDVHRNPDGTYVNYYKQLAWEGWQARAALASQPTAQVEPLTDEQIDSLIAQIVDPIATYGRLIKFARAIEAAHHIGRKA